MPLYRIKKEAWQCHFSVSFYLSVYLEGLGTPRIPPGIPVEGSDTDTDTESFTNRDTRLQNNIYTDTIQHQHGYNTILIQIQ